MIRRRLRRLPRDDGPGDAVAVDDVEGGGDFADGATVDAAVGAAAAVVDACDDRQTSRMMTSTENRRRIHYSRRMKEAPFRFRYAALV